MVGAVGYSSQLLSPMGVVRINDEDNGEGSNNGGGKDNNHQSSRDRDRNRSTGMGNNMVQDRVASLTVNNIVPPQEDDGIGGYQLLYLE